MKRLRRRAFIFCYWLADKANVPDTRTARDETRWWDLSMSFNGTEEEADDILNKITDLGCGNPVCGEFGEFCERDWVAGSNIGHEPTMNVNATINPTNYTATVSPLKAAGSE
jgi:hypothetical protein